MELYKNQKLFLLRPTWGNKNKIQEPEEVIIDKIGNKYFTIINFPRSKFSIETLQEVNDSNYKSQCYISIQEILDLREKASLLSKITAYFNRYPKNISLENLRQLNAIIFNE